MSNATVTDQGQDLRDDYAFDYSKAKPNRFASKGDTAGVNVVLEPDVALHFPDSAVVNRALRAILAALPETLSK